MTREWFGTVGYSGNPKKLHVALIGRFSPGCSELAGYPQVSASAGPKNYIKNEVYAVLEQTHADELVIVRASGPTFTLLRKGSQWFDIGHDERGNTTFGDPVEVIL